jgi:hypothetical protein
MAGQQAARAVFKRTAAIPSSVETRVKITHRCGHEGETVVRGDPARSRWLDIVRDRDCLDCVRKAEAEVDRRATAEGKRCELQGSEGQVRWAVGIRHKRALAWTAALSEIIEACNGAGVERTAVQRLVKEVRGVVSDVMLGRVTWEFQDGDDEPQSVGSDAARWWIDTRNDRPAALLGHLLGAGDCPDDWSAIVAYAKGQTDARGPSGGHPDPLPRGRDGIGSPSPAPRDPLADLGLEPLDEEF